MPTRKPLHIVETSFLDGNEVLVGFSDGTAAIYEAEELEKLRPIRKRTLQGWPAWAAIDDAKGTVRL
jgi:hypothetical protein